MYRVCSFAGDTIAVPQLVFSKLGTENGSEARFRVALHLLHTRQADVAGTAQALHIRPEEAERALSFWEGAGLLENIGPAPGAPQPKISAAAPRAALAEEEVQRICSEDATLGALMQEIQQILGVLIGHHDRGVLVMLYAQDAFPADLIMMAAHQCAAEGKTTLRALERRLFAWRKEGIADCDAADQYLKKLALRAEREGEVAGLLALDAPSFTLAERRRIAQWFEDYGYGRDMIDAARHTAGSKQDDVKYLHKILERWHKKGYKAPREVWQAQGGGNLRVSADRPKTGDDMLENAGYVPMRRRGEGP